MTLDRQGKFGLAFMVLGTFVLIITGFGLYFLFSQAGASTGNAILSAVGLTVIVFMLGLWWLVEGFIL